jgi:hypothetical protein
MKNVNLLLILLLIIGLSHTGEADEDITEAISDTTETVTLQVISSIRHTLQIVQHKVKCKRSNK